MAQPDPNDSLTGIPVASQHFTNAVLGPVIVGWTVNLITWGIMISAFLSYISSRIHRSDGKRTKIVLYIVVMLATAQSSLVFWSLYHYATWQARDVNTLYSQTTVDCLLTLFVSFEAVIVQLFLAHRAAFLFSNNTYRIIFYIWIILGVLCSLFGAMGYLGLSLAMLKGTWSPNFPLTFGIAVGSWLWGAAVTDVSISIGLCCLLSKRIVGFNPANDSMLRRLIRLALEAAAYTAVMAAIGAICSDSFSATSIYSNTSGAFWQPLSSLYALSLIITLSSRRKIREKQESERVYVPDTSALGNSIIRQASHISNGVGRAPSPSPALGGMLSGSMTRTGSFSRGSRESPSPGEVKEEEKELELELAKVGQLSTFGGKGNPHIKVDLFDPSAAGGEGRPTDLVPES
ncbi:hypothetical protein T439DRAFT_325112 [Meredithblackwellia eburnea MCA 4105]